MPVQLGSPDCFLGCDLCGTFQFFPCCSEGPACAGDMFCIDSVEEAGRSMCVESCGGEGEVPCNGAPLRTAAVPLRPAPAESRLCEVLFFHLT